MFPEIDGGKSNYPEGYEKKPWCPNTQLINICASLAGFEVKPERFCYEEASNEVYSEGFIHWLEYADFFPRVSCLTINTMLIDQLVLAKRRIKPSSESKLKEEIARLDSARDIVQAAKKYEDESKSWEKREEIVNRWRKTVFETCCSTTSDERNQHFRQVSCAEKLTEEEIIATVEKFNSALNEITGYKPCIIRGNGGAINCSQSPRIHTYRR